MDKQRILIVDDTPDNIDLMVGVLSPDYEIKTAVRGERALEIARTEPQPDMILLDVMMPGVSGYDVCRDLKSDSRTRHIPVIFVTALNDGENESKGIGLGAVDYLTKPLNAAIVQARIKHHLERERNRKIITEYVEQLEDTINEMSALFETGMLVAGVVHDTKKYTTAMSMALESIIIPMIKERLDDSEPWVKELLFEMSDLYSNANQCSEFLESLLAINRKTERLEPVNVEKIIHQTINLVSYSLIQEGIEWEIDRDTEADLFAIGNGQLIRVMMNLIVNAIDALKKHEIPDPKITIRIKEADQRIKIYVIDNGPGITTDVLEGIRKGMILSTKGKGGNGFGVSGLRKIVESLNGQLDIESQVGKGATFIVTLQSVS